jgi:hypothetical protein
MKETEFRALKKGDRVWHKHFGPCVVVDHVVWMGGAPPDPILQPQCFCGKSLLLHLSGMTGPVHEPSKRLVSLKRPDGGNP